MTGLSQASTATAASRSPTAPSKLSSLPAEIRLYIYELAVVEDKTLHISREGSEVPYLGGTAVQPALARVNRQLRNEVLPLFYAKSRFGLTGDGHHAFLAWLATNARYLRIPLNMSIGRRISLASSLRVDIFIRRNGASTSPLITLGDVKIIRDPDTFPELVGPQTTIKLYTYITRGALRRHVPAGVDPDPVKVLAQVFLALAMALGLPLPISWEGWKMVAKAGVKADLAKLAGSTYKEPTGEEDWDDPWLMLG